MLILDEPTTHLDVDAREALVQALNAYEGAVVLISHDRHMLELTADRLVLVDHGTAVEFSGSMDDYTDLILGRNQPKAEGGKFNKKGDRKAAAQAREKAQEMHKRARDAEAELERLTAERSAVDRAMAEPGSAEPRYAKMTMTELMKRSAEIAAALEQAEAAWLTASEALEPLEAAM